MAAEELRTGTILFHHMFHSQYIHQSTNAKRDDGDLWTGVQSWIAWQGGDMCRLVTAPSAAVGL